MNGHDLQRRLSRRRFLIGAGLGMGAFFAEAGGTVVRAAIGERAPIREPRFVTGRGAKVWNPDPYVTPEQLTPRVLPVRGAQPVLAADMRRPGLRTKIGQMLLVGFRGTTADPRSRVVADITRNAVGGVVLFDRTGGRSSTVRNISSPAQLRTLVSGLQAAALRTPPGSPLIVAVDQEGGAVARLNRRNGFAATPTAASLGARNDPAATLAQATSMARTLAAMGINLNLAPVVDLNVNPRNPAIGRNGRSFSADPRRVVAHAGAFVDGHRAVGVRTTLKHFPGQGSAAGDTHLGVVDVTRRWTDAELAPFTSLVGAGRADAVMTGHIFNARLDPDHPATLSTAVVTGLLRERIGFGGVVVSDDLQMGAIRAAYGWDEAVALAVIAGVDLLMIADPPTRGPNLVTRTIDVIEDLVAAGRVSEERIDASYDRIQALKATLIRAPA
ncbi:MAG TPA: glycoside hydrolase family 3 N-terminal domain-containing protein [Candidatus Limnocylindria bacterium]|nr:glycoside hydrolase family 3 N-terminal domain-containing protein [Candidatus Limnocylindria bacterium]